jgi:hypothetical protein
MDIIFGRIFVILKYIKIYLYIKEWVIVVGPKPHFARYVESLGLKPYSVAVG